MPNHHHGIVWIEPKPDDTPGPSLGDIMQWFKTVTTVRYSDGVHSLGWPPYDRRLWHRNYYDHIIRDDRDLNRIRKYIENNPSNWNTDDFYMEPECRRVGPLGHGKAIERAAHSCPFQGRGGSTWSRPVRRCLSQPVTSA